MKTTEYVFPRVGETQGMPYAQSNPGSVQNEARSGFREGFEAGMNKAREEAAALKAEASRQGFADGLARAKEKIAQALDALRKGEAELAALSERIETEMEQFSLEFSLGVLRIICAESKPVRRTVMTRLIRNGLEILSREAGLEEDRAPKVTARLNPADFSVLHENFGPELAELGLKPDPEVAAGSIRLEYGISFVAGSIQHALDEVEALARRIFVRRRRVAKVDNGDG